MRRRRLPGILSVLVSLALAAVVAALMARDGRDRPSQKTARLRLPELPAKAAQPKPARAGVVALRLPPPPRPAATVARPAPAPPKSLPPAPSPAPKPVRAIAPVPVEPPPPAPAPRSATPAPPIPEVRVTVNRDMRHEGRVLLRLLEHGSGPTIEIAWPDSGGARGRLYRHLVRCYGMEDAVMDEQGRLYGPGGAAGVPWRLDLDRYSGFLRRPLGRGVAEEEAGAGRLRARHGLAAGRTVRVFPRRVDAVMLGGIARAAGDRYRNASTIDARYELRGGRLFLDGLRVDGAPLDGAIDLTSARHRPC